MRQKGNKLVFEVEFDTQPSPYKGRHNNIYLHKYLTFRQSMLANLEHFIQVDVLPKEPPHYYSSLTSKQKDNLFHDSKHNKLVHFPRRDSFEVTVDGFILYSRLNQGGWPSADSLSEWALRVVQKLPNLNQQTPREQNQAKKVYSSRKEKSLQATPRAAAESQSQNRELSEIDKLPPLATLQQRASIHSNYTTLPVQQAGRYEGQQEHQLPIRLSGNRPTDFQTTRYYSKQRNKPVNQRKKLIQQPRQSLYYADSKPKSKYQSFHWHFGALRSISRGRTTLRVNEDNPRKDIYRHKNVQLTPLPNQTKIERDRVIAERLSGNEKKDSPVKVQYYISESNLNSYRSLYHFEGNSMKKISNNNAWSPLISENPLPLKGIYYVAFSVIRSAANMVQLGIAPLSYYPKADKNDSEFQVICFNPGTGMIRDSKLDQSATKTSWRLGGQIAPKDKPYQMRLAVDTQNYYIDWFIQDTIVASSKLPNLYSEGFRVFISLFNTNDSVLLNEQGWQERIPLSKFHGTDSLLEQQSPKGSVEAGKIKKVLCSSAKKERPDGMSEGAYNRSERMFHSQFMQEYAPMTIDEEMQTQFIGRIKHQRLSRYQRRRSKVDEEVMTDRIDVPNKDNPQVKSKQQVSNKDEEGVQSKIEIEQLKTKQEPQAKGELQVEEVNSISAWNHLQGMRWTALFNEQNQYSLELMAEEAQQNNQQETVNPMKSVEHQNAKYDKSPGDIIQEDSNHERSLTGQVKIKQQMETKAIQAALPVQENPQSKAQQKQAVQNFPPQEQKQPQTTEQVNLSQTEPQKVKQPLAKHAPHAPGVLQAVQFSRQAQQTPIEWRAFYVDSIFKLQLSAS